MDKSSESDETHSLFIQVLLFQPPLKRAHGDIHIPDLQD